MRSHLLALERPKRARVHGPGFEGMILRFKAQQPQYSAECLNYENLWKDVTETFKDEEDGTLQNEGMLWPTRPCPHGRTAT